MSNRLDDVLSTIDAETAKCICGHPLPANGPSLDYCSLPCQYRWTATLVGTEPAGDTIYDADDEITDGREIVQQVARELAQAAPPGAAEYRSLDSMRHRADQEPTSDETSSTRIMFVQNIADPNAPTLAELATGVDLTPFISADWAHAMHQVASAGRLSFEEAARSLDAALRPAPEPPLTGDDLRARALEHRHNRGTGPARRDNRRRNPR
jgi:hypothetical protein